MYLHLVNTKSVNPIPPLVRYPGQAWRNQVGYGEGSIPSLADKWGVLGGYGMKRKLRTIFVFISNLVVFISCAINHGIYPWRWPEAWRLVQADHEAWVRGIVFQLRMEGKIRQDDDGYLWPISKDD
jgi:hypothetical protein